jgi:hypothetical protein
MPIVSTDGTNFATIPDNDPDLPEIRKMGGKVYHDVEMNGHSARVPEEDLSQVLSAGAKLRGKIQPTINAATQRELDAGTLVRDPVTGMVKPAQQASETPDYATAAVQTIKDAGTDNALLRDAGEGGRVALESAIPFGRNIVSGAKALIPEAGTTYGQRYQKAMEEEKALAEKQYLADIAGSTGTGFALGIGAGKIIPEGVSAAERIASGVAQGSLGSAGSVAHSESQKPVQEMSLGNVREAAVDPLALGIGGAVPAGAHALKAATKGAAQFRSLLSPGTRGVLAGDEGLAASLAKSDISPSLAMKQAEQEAAAGARQANENVDTGKRLIAEDLAAQNLQREREMLALKERSRQIAEKEIPDAAAELKDYAQYIKQVKAASAEDAVTYARAIREKIDAAMGDVTSRYKAALADLPATPDIEATGFASRSLDAAVDNLSTGIPPSKAAQIKSLTNSTFSDLSPQASVREVADRLFEMRKGLDAGVIKHGAQEVEFSNYEARKIRDAINGVLDEIAPKARAINKEYADVYKARGTLNKVATKRGLRPNTYEFSGEKAASSAKAFPASFEEQVQKGIGKIAPEETEKLTAASKIAGGIAERAEDTAKRAQIEGTIAEKQGELFDLGTQKEGLARKRLDLKEAKTTSALEQEVMKKNLAKTGLTPEMFEASKTALSDVEGVTRDVGRPLTTIEKADLLRYRLKDAGFDVTKLTDENARDLLRAHETKLRDIAAEGGGNLSALEQASQQFVQPYSLRRAVSALTGGGDPLDLLWKEAKARAAYTASAKGSVPQTNMKTIVNPRTGETLDVPTGLAAMFTAAVKKAQGE